MVVVRRHSDLMRQAAAAAARGSGDLRAAQVKALDAIADAEADGFRVGEDLSVTDTQQREPAEAAARQRVATEHAEYIRWHAEQLAQTDSHIATQVTATVAELGGTTFEQSGDDSTQMLTDDEERQGPEYATDISSGDVEVIDRANRELLQEMLEDVQQLPDGQVKQDRLADIAAIEEALRVPDSHLIYVEKPDDWSEMVPAATAVSDPFEADHVSVTVPGVSSTTRGAIAGMTRESYQLQQEAIDVARRVGASQNVAAVAWVGYQPPPNLGSTDVLSDDLAQAGAPKLTSFLHDLDAAKRNPDQTLALFGHSYGSLTSGIALQDGASQVVDNSVMYGSPGFKADTPADLGMNDNNFFVMSASDDPINYIADLAPLHGWGSSPNDVIDDDGDLRFRFQHLEADAGLTPIDGYESKIGASGHSEYGRDAGDRMTGYNLAAILLDRPDLTVKETPLSW
nr:alpha/beta hydrolase [Mycobacterium sp. GA-1285]